MCPTCGKAFRVRANYYKHRKIHERTSAEQQQQEQDQPNQSTQSEQLPGHNEIQRTSAHSTNEEVANVNVSLPTSQSGLLETYAVSFIYLFFFCEIVFMKHSLDSWMQHPCFKFHRQQSTQFRVLMFMGPAQFRMKEFYFSVLLILDMLPTNSGMFVDFFEIGRLLEERFWMDPLIPLCL